MIVRPYDGTAPEPEPEPSPEPHALTFTPFTTVPLGHGHELRIDLARKGDSLSVSCRHWRSKGRGRPLSPDHPMHVFPEHLPALIAALTEAASASRPVATAPKAPLRNTTGVDLVPLKGPRPVLDPGDASPLGHPDDGEPAPVPFGAVDEKRMGC